MKKRTFLRSSENQESPTEDNGSTVEISKEELIKLAEQAGVKVKFASDYLQQEEAAQAREQQPSGPSMFEPAINALQPILKLPPILQYPALILIFGAVSAIFLPLFGSGSIKDMKSDSPPAPVASTATPEATKKVPTAADPSNDIAPKVLQIQRKSCDVFPYSLTPTCTDPDIGNKAILKNLDKYAKPPASVLKERAEQAK
ncbi:hypothetical protein GUITHDRAFT_114255 [Guillardia theta CCMP2712]|uniref:Uncharacterized protein n=2 Tax=Guillardia theta TaxID=55529 RepID=L1IU45_GUITC|nr:hypothetical protein GUITHDRAFT_114255 [Guillardia theta CCMP2712]EKX39758.1 hypothetical protein GUITHDRAFT_114255 [Guillardia theta CCMP2712]|eukprot:XP_005826738.1 hypothetical protein GUITHDRAFT_114255 [Guillardia theta CCMP2712]